MLVKAASKTLICLFVLISSFSTIIVVYISLQAIVGKMRKVTVFFLHYFFVLSSSIH